MELSSVQQALRSIPRVDDDAASEPAESGVTDLLGAATEFSKLLRKLGIQQTREVRDILSTIRSGDPQSEQVREAWQREQQRASGSEQQLSRLAEVLIGTFDILDRMLAAFADAGGMEDWELQARQAVDLSLHNAEKVGLVPLGSPGERFDVAIHDLVREVPRGHRGAVKISAVVTRGYALNGKVLRRAVVDFREP
jgi:predicted NBD/HSP70 family sugar kinase